MKNTKETNSITACPRVAAIHDLSCFGRCALTVIIPTLSALHAQVIPFPTALLSSHTGGFENLYFRDLSDSMNDIAAHFDRLNLKFDAIYSGFLGSEAQIEQVEGFIDRFCKSVPVLVDPVMGDDGKLYSTYTPELMAGMRKLCRKADIITPNFTEACFLTDTPFRDTGDMTENETVELGKHLLSKLSSLGAKKIVITGLVCHKSIITIGKDCYTNEIFVHKTKRLGISYPGTGDIFASVVLGMMLSGADFKTAVSSACDYTAELIRFSIQFNTPVREGVMLEHKLSKLEKMRNRL